jgi:sensor c-di-GMP phosphodiesterase-like protein
VPKPFRLLFSERYRRLRGVALWAGLFLITLLLMGVIAAVQVDSSVRSAAEEGLAPYVSLRENFRETFKSIHSDVNAVPCSEKFLLQLRKVAYRPDGFNEFLYAPGGVVRCSVNAGRFDPPLPLGTPDFALANGGETKVWMDRSLTFLGLDGLTGTIALIEPFAIVLPAQNIHLPSSNWMRSEIVAQAPNGRWWHRYGERGIYYRARYSESRHGAFPVLNGLFHQLDCLSPGIHCAATEVSLTGLVANNPAPFAMALLLAAAIAQSLAAPANRLITNYWSFDARFRRRINADSIRCVYQPILDFRTGTIFGCEVLARWRDVDGTIAMPDQFIPIVERSGQTALFTRLVIGRALRELSAHVPADRHLEVNFNIFPRDLDAAWLHQAFSAFGRNPERFDIAVEIVESDALRPERAKTEIEALSRFGIRTYIDDFGTAYANIHTLAELPVEGVKLDRSFAQAPEDSLLANLLSRAIEMIHSTGRKVIVEGVETAARMALLVGTPVDRVQGYFISRPLEISEFVAFLEQHEHNGVGDWAPPNEKNPQVSQVA